MLLLSCFLHFLHKSFSESIASASSSRQTVDTFPLAREEKVKTEPKIMYIKEQMDFYKYMLSSEHYDFDEKKKAKEGQRTYGKTK
jgi:hypothetical protein